MARHLSQPRFIGRERPFSQLEDARAAASNDRVALVIGPAGIGKTTLLQQFRTHAIDEGCRVGWGVAGGWEGAPGLWPWFEALSDIDPDQDVISAGHDDSPGALDMAEMFRGVALWLLAKGADTNLVIVIEDLHHAHPTAVALFGYLTRRPAMPGITLIATSRPGHDDVEALRCARITLDGLSGDDIIQLAAEKSIEIPPATADELARRTDGNPLFIHRLLEQGVVGPEAPIPPDVAALLRGQVETVPPAIRPTLDALAVLGSATTDLLQQMTATGSVETDLTSVSHDLLRISGTTVGFRHGLVREVVYRDLDADDRFRLHAKAADVLRSNGSGPVAVAHHLSRAAQSNRGPEAADAARQAALVERQSGAVGEAAHHFGVASAILRDLGDNDALVGGLIEEAEALAQIGRGVDAEQRLIEAATTTEATTGDAAVPSQRRRDLVRAYARLRWLEEPNPSRLDAEFLISIAQNWLASSTDSADQAVLHTAMATAGDIHGGRFDDVTHADLAVEAADAADDAVLLGEARLARRRALSVHPTRFDERRADAEAALKIARHAHDGEFLVRAQRMALTDALAAADRQRVMTLLADEPVSVAGRVQRALAAATVAALEGRYDEADSVLDDTAKELDYLGFDAPALDFFRIVYSWDRGDLPAILRQYEPLLPSVADPALRAAVSLAKVIDNEEAVAATFVDEALATLSSGEPTTLWAVTMGILTETATAIDHPRCQEIYDALDGFSGCCVIASTSAASWIGAFDRYQGLLALRLGRVDDAIEHLEQSVVIHQRMNAVPWQARSHAALAAAHTLLGATSTAAAHSARAETLAAQSGMDPAMVLIGGLDRWAPESPSPAAAPPRQTARTGSFVRRGDIWALGLDGAENMLKHSKGLEYLALLLDAPEREWASHDLYAQVAGIPVVAESGTGPVLDAKARAAYQARRSDLIETLDEATANADIGAAEAAQTELDYLEAELIAAFGLGGRPRTTGDNAEKARVNVQRSIARSIAQIGTVDHVLADHLDRSVRTGSVCRYEPGPNNAVRWNT